jgi:hypothetical protein
MVGCLKKSLEAPFQFARKKKPAEWKVNVIFWFPTAPLNPLRQQISSNHDVEVCPHAMHMAGSTLSGPGVRVNRDTICDWQTQCMAQPPQGTCPPV